MKLKISDNDIELIQNKNLSFTDRELFIKALINIDYFHTLLEQCLYNPQNLLFSTQLLKYDNNDTSVYSDNQEKIYYKFENISKIIIANIIIKSYDIVLKDIYKCYIPSSFFAHEFDQLDLQFEPEFNNRKQTYSLTVANGIIYTTAMLKLFEQKIEKRNKRTEYKATIKKVLQVFVEEKQISEYNWKQVCKEFVKEEYYLPIGKLFFLLLFHGR